MAEFKDFGAFHCIWAEMQGWKVPDFHYRICEWLEGRRHGKDEEGVLRVFRGAAKSTLAAEYEAWTFSKDPRHRVLVQASEDKTARKLSRDCKHVLRRHPLCDGMLPERDVAGDAFWVMGHNDYRNPSMNAQGVMSNVTSSRANEVLFDDVEVPKNIVTQDSRDMLRRRTSEATHILLPHGRKLWIGTPHTHDSIYDEREKDGADSLTIQLFALEERDETASNLKVMQLEWDAGEGEDLFVFNGRDLLDPHAYVVKGQRVEFVEAQTGIVQVYGGTVWPDYFTRDVIRAKRRGCISQNEWDSQYLLRSRPIHDIRLNPDRVQVYDDEPIFAMANGEMTCRIGEHRIVSVRSYWDVSLGKVKGDVSSFTILFQSDHGHLFWHRCHALYGDLDRQCVELKGVALPLRLPRVSVETNGVGGFVPAVLKKHMAGTGCAVKETVVSGNKAVRIIHNIEPALSGGYLHAHRSVQDCGAFQQMRDFVPEAEQADDHLDSLAGAISESPARIPRPDAGPGDAWHPNGLSHPVSFVWGE